MKRIENKEGIATVKEIKNLIQNLPDDTTLWIKGSGILEKVSLVEYADTNGYKYLYLEGELVNKFSILKEELMQYGKGKSENSCRNQEET